MKTKKSTSIETAIKIGLIALLGLWCFQIARPFISPVVWAGIIAIGTYPVFLWLKGKTGLGAGWTATIITFFMLFILITPTVIISGALIENAETLSGHIENDQLEIPPPPEGVAEWPLIGEKLNVFWTQASQDRRTQR